ncbi:MAG: helix-turn-helix domain-containing protein [Muribaculaceae bacterium]|nr:helix-turn-helix domain-containing protein [Muribaculaceae bacterium]
MNMDLNRLKIVLAEQKKTNKWLAEQLGKDPATVSKWCTNSSQPGLETLRKIAEVFNIDIRDLIISTKNDKTRLG